MKKVLISTFGIFVVCILVFVAWVLLVLSKLPDVSTLKYYRPSCAAEVQDKDGNLLTHYYDRTFRIWVPISTLPDVVIHAVVTAEDDTFFEHSGVNYKATWDALVHDMHKRRFARGGSTITQQMIKNVLLSKEKTISRKVREYFLARRAEELFTKRRILEIYLNVVEWGDNIYGIEAASRAYFGKSASELRVAEAAFLAGMLPNPHYFNPFKHLDKARERQERVLFNMQQAKLITQEEYATALQTSLKFVQQDSGSDPSALSGNKDRPCYQYALENILLEVVGDVDLYRSGMTIKTTLDKNLQEELNKRENAAPGKSGQMSDPLIVVKQSDQVRAFVCSASREQEIRDMFTSRNFFSPGYEVSVVPLRSINPEQIVVSRATEQR